MEGGKYQSVKSKEIASLMFVVRIFTLKAAVVWRGGKYQRVTSKYIAYLMFVVRIFTVNAAVV